MKEQLLESSGSLGLFRTPLGIAAILDGISGKDQQNKSTACSFQNFLQQEQPVWIRRLAKSSSCNLG